jgi:hypothetical protein
MNRSYSKIRHIQEVNQRLEKRLVENVIVEGDVTEANPIAGLVKAAVQGGKTLMNKAMGTAAKKAPQYFDELSVGTSNLLDAKVPRMTANYLVKLGKRKVDDFITQALKKTRDEILFITRDWKNLQQSLETIDKKNAYYDIEPLRKFYPDGVLSNIEIPRGQVIDFPKLYLELKKLSNIISNVETTVTMSPDSKKILLAMKKNLQDAMEELDFAVSEIATK